jgi:hypothetical protein
MLLASASKLVEVANTISTGARRQINWIHMPMPRNRTDEAYFAPLRSLHLHPETELYLGLVHFTDGVELVYNKDRHIGSRSKGG